MTLATIRTAVNTEVGLSLSTLATTQLINRALRFVANEGDWPWLELVETGTWPDAETTTLAVTAKAVKSVNVEGSRYEAIAETDADTTAASIFLKGFSVADRELRIVPQPTEGAEYTVWYVAEEPTLAADADVPLIPDRFIDAVVMKACSMAHDRPQGDAKTRQNFEERANEVFAQMRRTAGAKRGSRLPRTRQDVP